MRTIKRDIVGAFIFSADNKLLLGQSKKGGVYQGCWVVPGGGMDEDESLKEALAREILEETGIDITGAKIIELEHKHEGKSEKVMEGEKVIVEMVFHDHTVKLPRPSREYHIVCDDDFMNARWFELSDLKNLKHSPPGIRSLKKLGLL